MKIVLTMISIWEQESFYRDTDVLIAGGGLMGLWTAWELTKQQPGIKVTICEALPVPALASTRNAGFACFGSPGELWSDLQTMGEDAMWQVVEMRYKGIQKILNVFGPAAIGFDPSGGYELYDPNPEWNGDGLQEKLELLNKGFYRISGLQQVYTNCSSRMEQFGITHFAAMAGNSIEGGLHSGKLVMALQQLVRQQGVVYLEGHAILSSSKSKTNLWMLQDNRNGAFIQIKADAVIWATNALLSNFAGMEPAVRPARGQVLLSPPVEGLKLFGTFHYDEGYYYFRNLGDRLLIGGARNHAFAEEETTVDLPTEKIRGHLEDFIREKFPQVAPLLGQKGWLNWAGIMGMSAQKLPVVKEIEPGEWAAFACNGMGVALTPMVGEEVAKQVIATMK